PTKPFPEVTRFEIVFPERLEIRINELETILVETDADSEFDKRGLVVIRSEPEILEIASKTPLKGGRVRWRMRVKEDINAGQVGQIIATITKPNGQQITSTIDFEVLPKLEKPAKSEKG